MRMWMVVLVGCSGPPLDDGERAAAERALLGTDLVVVEGGLSRILGGHLRLGAGWGEYVADAAAVSPAAFSNWFTCGVDGEVASSRARYHFPECRAPGGVTIEGDLDGVFGGLGDGLTVDWSATALSIGGMPAQVSARLDLPGTVPLPIHTSSSAGDVTLTGSYALGADGALDGTVALGGGGTLELRRLTVANGCPSGAVVVGGSDAMTLGFGGSGSVWVTTARGASGVVPYHCR